MCLTMKYINKNKHAFWNNSSAFSLTLSVCLQACNPVFNAYRQQSKIPVSWGCAKQSIALNLRLSICHSRGGLCNMDEPDKLPAEVLLFLRAFCPPNKKIDTVSFKELADWECTNIHSLSPNITSYSHQNITKTL